MMFCVEYLPFQLVISKDRVIQKFEINKKLSERGSLIMYLNKVFYFYCQKRHFVFAQKLCVLVYVKMISRREKNVKIKIKTNSSLFQNQCKGAK